MHAPNINGRRSKQWFLNWGSFLVLTMTNFVAESVEHYILVVERSLRLPHRSTHTLHCIAEKRAASATSYIIIPPSNPNSRLLLQYGTLFPKSLFSGMELKTNITKTFSELIFSFGKVTLSKGRPLSLNFAPKSSFVYFLLENWVALRHCFAWSACKRFSDKQ